MNIQNVHTIADINVSAKLLKEHYAQVGLEVDIDINGLNWPQLDPDRGEGVLRLFKGDTYVNGYLMGPMSENYKEFIRETDPAGINIFFLFSSYSSKGYAMTPSQIKREEDDEIELKYFDKAFVNFAAGQISGSTPAHELLHILAYKTEGNDHDEAFYNLLNIENANFEPVLFSKRINIEQEARIYDHWGMEDL